MIGEVTTLLQDLPSADKVKRKQILDQVVTLLAGELRERARYRMALEPAGHILQATALLNEFYLRVVNSEIPFEDRQHFMLAAARIMRNIVVDEARRFRAEKRGGRLQETALDYENAGKAAAANPDSILDLNEAVEKLPTEDARLIELRFFYGLTLEETATTMGIEYEALRKRWVRIRRQLYKLLVTAQHDDA